MLLIRRTILRCGIFLHSSCNRRCISDSTVFSFTRRYRALFNWSHTCSIGFRSGQFAGPHHPLGTLLTKKIIRDAYTMGTCIVIHEHKLRSNIDLSLCVLFLKSTPPPFNCCSLGRYVTYSNVLHVHCVSSSTNHTWKISSKSTRYIRRYYDYTKCIFLSLIHISEPTRPY